MRRGLLSLLIAVCLYSPAFCQVDSASHAIPQASAAADSNRSIVSDTQQAPASQAIVVDSVIEPETAIDPASEISEGYPVYWVAGAGILGLLLGAVGYRLLFRKKEHADTDPLLSTASDDAKEPENQLSLERENEELREQNTRLIMENEQLKRDTAELEQLLHIANDNSSVSGNAAVEEIVFYMPQPNMNGRFQEASRRTDAADALYAFRIQPDHAGVASFEFIAKNAYLNAAIGNEPTWIAIACDRANQPSALTTRVRTDVPGMAQLKDGEWEITRKAKITYL